jgi:Ca2+-binding RTX toxin-like protein
MRQWLFCIAAIGTGVSAYSATCLDSTTDDCTANMGGASICIVTTTTATNDTVKCDLTTKGTGTNATAYAVKNGSSWEVFGRDNGGNDFCCVVAPDSASHHYFALLGDSTANDTLDFQYTTGGTTYDLSPLSSTQTSAAMQGYAGMDTLNGSNYSGNDLEESLYGGDGGDTIRGRAGNDNLYGGAGSDNLYGDAGDDDLFCGADADTTVFGGDGNDFIQGEGGNDTLDGDAGNDIIEGGDGADTLNGDAGDDILRGGDNDDTLNGGVDDDVLCGDADVGAGGDTLNGGDDNDVLWGGSPYVSDVLDGGDGQDDCGEDPLKAPFTNCEVDLDDTERPDECAAD